MGLFKGLSILALAAQALANSSLEIIQAQVVKESLKDHHVGGYRVSRFGYVVRRGFPFQLTVTTTEPLPQGASFDIATDKRPVKFEVVNMETKKDNQYLLTVNTPPDAQIDMYDDISIVVKSPERRERFEFFYPWPIYLVYNPYNPEDKGAYWGPDNHTLLEEYLNDEYGVIFDGSLHDYDSIRWFYGQHDEDSLKAAFYLLDKFNDTSDPALTSLHLTKRIMYNDKQNPDGILEGRWEETFPNGTSPEAWTSSDKIIKLWHVGNHVPVKYGQCWVFAALTNTLVCTIGIPSRQLTAFGARIDQTARTYKTYHHIVIQHYTEDGRLLASEGSVWNFHSWIDIHINRPDLGTDQWDGWQALDGVWPGLGPAPVKAVHDLADNVMYNVDNVISTVHASVQDVLEVCDMKPPGTGRVTPEWLNEHCKANQTIKYDNQGVRLIVSKSPVAGDFSGQDITEVYVNKSVDAFIPFEPTPPPSANSLSPHPFTVSLTPKRLRSEVGAPIECVITARSPSDQVIVDLLMVAQLTDNYGEAYEVVGQKKTTVVAGAQGTDVLFRVEPEDYIKNNLHGRFVELRVFATVRESGQTVMECTVVRLTAPAPFIKAPGVVPAESEREHAMHIEFTNPLPHSLTNLKLTLHAPALPDIHNTEHTISSLMPEQPIRLVRPIVASVPGVHTVLVSMSADNLPHFFHSFDVVVA
eukprot:comp21242_c0_seq1/m.28930 comp21242_c0_seq1/g.28930  ORF comp21242_c0_seq1/g.28930 comp21242_c0_seq1/m.28930 type:complete len:697 (-) comp21242_c0_seq1:565-2655(-)